MGDRYLCIDTEGTGLFVQRAPDGSVMPSDAPGQPRLCSIAMIELDENLAVTREFSTLIKPEGWEFDDKSEAAQVNGLTAARLNAEGISIGDVLDRYTASVKAGFVLVAHNAQHDLRHMRAELRHAGRDDLFHETKNICTMRAMTNVCCILKANPRTDDDWKFPKLIEALDFIGYKNEGAHTALGDARGAVELLRYMHGNSLLPEAGVHLAKAGKPKSAPKKQRAAKAAVVSADDELPA